MVLSCVSSPIHQLQLDIEVLVIPAVKQGTLNHNIHVPIDRDDCLGEESDGLYRLDFSQMGMCAHSLFLVPSVLLALAAWLIPYILMWWSSPVQQRQ
jgi:hypothetical protein